LGLAILIRDKAAAQPELPGLASIIALCASGAEETLKAVSTGAGRLFLACVDGRFRLWARPLLGQTSLSDRIRGEAILLPDAAKQSSDKKDQKLRETFLLHKVADLRAVCYPWHPEIEWKDLETAG
jgi:hypothetical protein